MILQTFKLYVNGIVLQVLVFKLFHFVELYIDELHNNMGCLADIFSQFGSIPFHDYVPQFIYVSCWWQIL